MTLTFDLLTSKSIGRILDSWWVSVWSFMIIGWLQSQLSSGNHFQTRGQHIGATYKSILKVLLKQYRSPTDPNKFKSATIISVDHFQIPCAMTLTVDLLTPKSIGHILDSWWVSVWSFIIIGWLQSQLSSGNHFQITMRHDLDLWPFDLKINRAHPWLMVSKCMKFHDHWLITESVIVRKPFSNNHAPWPWPLDLEINRAHPWLMVSKCMKFHDHWLITESVIVRKPFSNNHAPWPWPLTFWPQNQ